MTQPPCSIDLSIHFMRCLGACVVLASFADFDEANAQTSGRDPISLTHGPMLGQPTATSMVVWGRTFDPGEYTVHYGTDPEQLDQISQPGTTTIEHDNTGTVQLVDLRPDTRYHYQIHVNGRPHGLPGSFLTLPSAESSKNAEHNSKGLLNFRFQIGSNANQNPLNGVDHSLEHGHGPLRMARHVTSRNCEVLLLSGAFTRFASCWTSNEFVAPSEGSENVRSSGTNCPQGKVQRSAVSLREDRSGRYVPESTR
jgi:hypothetical protein